MRRLGLLVLLALAGGCGLREPLEPPPGASLPVAPVAAAAPPTAEQLLAAPVITRPQRVDELIRRSELREDDRFDLPPPEVPAGVVPIPVENDERSGDPQR